MKTELFKLVYDKAVWPKNLALDHPPQRREATEGIYFQVIRKLQEDGIQVAPGGTAKPTGPKPVPAPDRPAAPEGSLKDYILSRTSRLSHDDEDADPLAAE